MKQNIYIEKKAFSPDGQNIKMAEARFGKTEQEVPLPFVKGGTAAAILPALLIKKGSQHIGRDGPPGRARSPGIHFIQALQIGLFLYFNTIIYQPNFIKLKLNHLQQLNFLS